MQKGLFVYETLNPFEQAGTSGPRHSRTARTVALAFAGALALLATDTEGAYAAEDPPSKRVSYADLNLRSPQGRATLVRRVKYAARQVCDSGNFQLSMPLRRDTVCVRKTTERAMAQVERAFEVAALTR